MVNYAEARELMIENVEHPIHILGVEAQGLVFCFWGLILMLSVNPLLAPFGALGVAVVSRFFFSQAQRGRPVTYRPIIWRRSFLKRLFPSIEGLIITKDFYSGS